MSSSSFLCFEVIAYFFLGSGFMGPPFPPLPAWAAQVLHIPSPPPSLNPEGQLYHRGPRPARAEAARGVHRLPGPRRAIPDSHPLPGLRPLGLLLEAGVKGPLLRRPDNTLCDFGRFVF